ncbi:MAG: FAD/NAD(P)-binding protein [Coriobacteriales bacterium]
MNEQLRAGISERVVSEYDAMSGIRLMAANPYRPWPARIISITELTATEKLFELRLIDPRVRMAFTFDSGQFIELSIFGVGEAPISITSSPTRHGSIQLCVRRTGTVTSALHDMQCGDIVGVRGPFGRGFPFEAMKGSDLLLVAGGLGIAPLKSLINHVHDERSQFGNVNILYGSRGPAEVMFRDEFEMWQHRKDFNLVLTVDRQNATSDWDGEAGRVTDHFDKVDLDPDNAYGVIVGPPPMYRSVAELMRGLGLSNDHIYVDLERSMRCGMGKCGHCMVGHQYVCIDGPVFNYWEAVNIQEAM